MAQHGLSDVFGVGQSMGLLVGRNLEIAGLADGRVGGPGAGLHVSLRRTASPAGLRLGRAVCQFPLPAVAPDRGAPDGPCPGALDTAIRRRGGARAGRQVPAVRGGVGHVRAVRAQALERVACVAAVEDHAAGGAVVGASALPLEPPGACAVGVRAVVEARDGLAGCGHDAPAGFRALAQPVLQGHDLVVAARHAPPGAGSPHGFVGGPLERAARVTGELLLDHEILRVELVTVAEHRRVRGQQDALIALRARAPRLLTPAPGRVRAGRETRHVVGGLRTRARRIEPVRRRGDSDVERGLAGLGGPVCQCSRLARIGRDEVAVGLFARPALPAAELRGVAHGRQGRIGSIAEAVPGLEPGITVVPVDRETAFGRAGSVACLDAVALLAGQGLRHPGARHGAALGLAHALRAGCAHRVPVGQPCPAVPVGVPVPVDRVAIVRIDRDDTPPLAGLCRHRVAVTELAGIAVIGRGRGHAAGRVDPRA